MAKGDVRFYKKCTSPTQTVNKVGAGVLLQHRFSISDGLPYAPSEEEKILLRIGKFVAVLFVIFFDDKINRYDDYQRSQPDCQLN